jgi:glyoxylase-like metal-dependent hydrolase (beta-lactamase superfamily II)
MTSENTSRHYALEKLCNGVYTAVARDGGAAIGNAGIVDLGDSTLIVDTFLTPTAAEDLRADAQRLTRRLPHWVVNTHYHNDHIWGNQVFLPQADLISTDRTRALIQTAGQQEYDEYRLITDDRLKETLAQQAAAKTDEQRASLGLMVGYFSGLAHDFPRLRLTLPNQVFEHRMAIHGSQRRVEIMEFRGAHTGSDAVVYLPDDGIVFMSDLLFIGVHPYLGDGNPDRWVDVLRSIAAWSWRGRNCHRLGAGG